MNLKKHISKFTSWFFPILAFVSSRENATAGGPIGLLPELRWQNISAAWGGNESFNATPGFANITTNAIGVYSDIIGQVAWVLIFSIPFIMMWFYHADMTLAGIVGIIIGSYLILSMPQQFLLVGLGFITISIAAIIWSLLQKRG